MVFKDVLFGKVTFTPLNSMDTLSKTVPWPLDVTVDERGAQSTNAGGGYNAIYPSASVYTDTAIKSNVSVGPARTEQH